MLVEPDDIKTSIKRSALMTIYTYFISFDEVGKRDIYIFIFATVL